MKKIIIIFIVILWTSQAMSAQLQMNSQTGQKGDSVSFTVFIHNAPDPVDAFGFEVSYDPTCMTFQSVKRGSLISNGFSFFQANNIQLGRIRIGGLESGDNRIQKAATGSLVVIQFNVIGDNSAAVKLQNLKDDLKTWTIQNGQMIVQSDNANENENTNENENIDNSNDEGTNVNADDSSPDDSVIVDSNERNQAISGSNSGSNQGNQSIAHPSESDIQTLPHSQSESSVSIQSGRHSTNDKRISSQPKKVYEKEVLENQKQIIAGNTPPKNVSNQQVARKQNMAQHKQQAEKLPNATKLSDDLKPEAPQKINWGRETSSSFAGSPDQNNVSVSQKHVYTFPSFITTIIVLSLIVQTAILGMLILLYRKLSNR